MATAFDFGQSILKIVRRGAVAAVLLAIMSAAAGCQDDGPLDQRITGAWVVRDPGHPLVKGTLMFQPNGTFRIREEYVNNQGRRQLLDFSGIWKPIDNQKILMSSHYRTQADGPVTRQFNAGIRFNSNDSMSVSFSEVVDRKTNTRDDFKSFNQRVVTYVRSGS